jgi:phage protein D
VFSYLNINFPTLDVPLHRAYEYTHTHARYEHELATIYFLNWAVPSDSIASGTPISVIVSGLHSSREFNGYIHHIQPDLSPSKNYVEVTVIGASYVLKQQGQKVWTNVTADAVVADIAKKHKFSYIATPHPRVYPQISQAGMSDWELLVKLAKQSGYSFKADNTTLIFQPLTQDFTESRQQANYYALGGLESKSTGIYSFKPLIGESIPFADAQKSTYSVGGVDSNTGAAHVNADQTPLKSTRKKSNPPVFDTYATNVVAPTFQASRHEAKAATERARYAYRGEVHLPGNPKLLPDSPVFLDGVGASYSGFWTILSVEHTVEEQMFTTKAIVGTDSLGLAAPWTDNKTISAPDEKVTRVISPGVRQKNIVPKTTLNKKGTGVKKGNVSHFSQAKNMTAVPVKGEASYSWAGSGRNLKTSEAVDPRRPSYVLYKLAAQNDR